MSIVSWIVVGGLAAMIMKTDHSLVKNIVTGIIGALIGGFVMNLLGSHGVTGFNLWSIFVSLIGSVILIAIVNLAKGRS